MTQRKFAILFVALFLFTIAWSAGGSRMLAEAVGATSEMSRYIVSKGLLTLVIIIALWRLKAFADVGFTRKFDLASFGIGLPLLVLGLLVILSPDKPALDTNTLIGWGLIALLVGFTEETIFRGILWQSLTDTSLWRRAIITSLFFGSIHMTGAFGTFPWTIAAAQSLFAASVGLTLAAMHERAGSLWSVIIVHAVFDMSALTASGGVASLFEPGLETYLRLLIPAAFFTAWGSAAILLLNRRAALSD